LIKTAKHRSQATVTVLHAEFEFVPKPAQKSQSQRSPRDNIIDKLLLVLRPSAKEAVPAADASDDTKSSEGRQTTMTQTLHQLYLKSKSPCCGCPSCDLLGRYLMHDIYASYDKKKKQLVYLHKERIPWKKGGERFLIMGRKKTTTKKQQNYSK